LNVDESTIEFYRKVLGEVMELFPSKFIHIGGDEAPKDQWRASSRAQSRMKQLGLRDENELQSWFIRQMDEFLTANGRRLIGWDEILEGGLARGATVMSWRGEDGGIAAARAGHDVVMAPQKRVYFDHYQSEDKANEGLAIGGLTRLEDVYAYDPVPAALTDAQTKHVLGAQGQVWTEYIPTPARVEYMAFPRACALAEVAWSPIEQCDFPSFCTRLNPHLERLAMMGVNYRRLDC
jgi:hexosaminidase